MLRDAKPLAFIYLILLSDVGCARKPDLDATATTEPRAVAIRQGDEASAEKRPATVRPKPPVFSTHYSFTTETLERWLPTLAKRTRLTYGPTEGQISDGLLWRMSEALPELETLHIDQRDNAPHISDEGMQHLSRMQKLRHLYVNARFSDSGLAHLARLPDLELLAIGRGEISAKELFATVATFPKVRSLSFVNVDFSQPIDDTTYQEIASLNGRVQSLSFGEWEDESRMHVSMIPAIAEIESLTFLQLGAFSGTTTAEHFEPIRKKLPYLSGPNIDNVRAFRQRDTHPVQFREITSPTEMFVLLMHLIGPDARKVCQEVVRRRAGISEGENFTTAEAPAREGIATILERSFGIKVSAGATNNFPDASGSLGGR